MLKFRLFFVRLYSTAHAAKLVAQNDRLLIGCKRKEFNHYLGKKYNNFDSAILASKAWSHRKSTSDYFVIYPHEKIKEEKIELAEKEEFTFADLNLDERIVKILTRHNLIKPTDIQLKAMPYLLDGRSALIVAETGCGKTLAYVLPIIERILLLKNEQDSHESTTDDFNNPYCVILAPSRELVIQIGEVIRSLFGGLGLRIEILAGGVGKVIQNPNVKDIDIVVSTVGGMNQMLGLDIYKTSRTRFVIADEADSLLDDSFSRKLSNIFTHYKFRNATNFVTHNEPKNEVQVMFVSATMPINIPEWIIKHVNPDSLKRITTNEFHQILPNVKQTFMRISKQKKAFELLRLVKEDVEKRKVTMIFSNNTATSDWISLFLNGNGIKCMNLNADVPFEIRKRNFEEFKNGLVNVLSCTDIGSRGLDTITVSHIINYDFPTFMADYIHRCGRTGRVGSPSNCKITNFIATGNEINITQSIEMSFRKMQNLPNVDGNITFRMQERKRKFLEQF